MIDFNEEELGYSNDGSKIFSYQVNRPPVKEPEVNIQMFDSSVEESDSEDDLFVILRSM